MAQNPESARLDEILAHGPWVRRLARRLLDDPSLVDDVCQETWMVALATGPADRSGMRAWLGGVVRNLVRRERRTGRRRRDREVRAALPGGDAAPARDLVAEAELHGQVTRAVVALPEPYRSTLLMRYFEDLDAAAIAERLGCSASTVRNRQRRALALLRDALDADHDGDRAAWCRALAPLALAAPGGAGSLASPLTGPAVSVPWKEMLLMTGAKKAVVATIVLAVVGTTWWALPGETVEPGSGAPPVVRAPVPADPAGPATPEIASPVESLAAQPPVASAAPAPAVKPETRPGTPARFAGRVVDTTGRPVADAVVTYVPDVHTLNAWGHPVSGAKGVPRVLPELDLPSTRTDEHGRFDVEGLYVVAPSAERTRQSTFNPLQFPELHASGPGLARTALVLRGYKGDDLDVPDLVVERGGRVTGRVVDEQGAPVAGVAVRGLRPVAEFSQASDDTEQKGHASSFLVATSDSDGRWVIEGTGECSAWLRMTAAGYLAPDAVHFETQPGEVVDRGEAVLMRGGTLAGRVLDDDGRPAPGARVRASDSDLAHWDRGTDTILYQIGSGGVFADEDGAFSISALTGGTHTVWVDAPGFEPRRMEGVALGRRDVVIAVQPQGLLFVDVVDAGTGQPVESATLVATRGTGIDRSPPQLVVEDRGVDTAMGRFRVERPGVVSTQLRVSAPGYAVLREDAPGVAVGKTGKHLMRLVPEALLEGVVVDARGAAVSDASVTLHRVPEVTPEPPPATKNPGMAGFYAQRDYEESLVADDLTHPSDADGRFRFDALVAGTYELSARAAGHAPSTVVTRVLERGGRLDDVRLELAAAGVLAGVVLDANGAPLRGEGVGVRRPGDQRITTSTTTALDGRFRFDSLAPGAWTVSVYPSVSEGVEVLADTTTEVQLVVRPRPVFRGRVFDPATGAGIANARVCQGWHGEVVEWSDPPGQRVWYSGNSVTTDADGTFELMEGSTGSQLLVAELPNGVITPSVPVRADWGDEMEVDLPTGTARVAGRVVTAEGKPPGAASVSLRGDIPNFGTGYAPCEPDGSFLIQHVAPGTYRLQVFAKDGVQLSPLDVVVPVSGVDDLLVTMGPAATLVVTVRLPNGEPVEDQTHVQLVEPGTDRRSSLWEETASGVVRLRRIVPGRYELVVGHLGNAAHFADETFVRWREPITLAAGEHRKLEIVLER